MDGLIQMKINWNQAKQDYLADSSVSLSNIADRYGISGWSVKQRAAKEGWVKLREETNQKASLKLPDIISESVAQFNARRFLDGKELSDQGLTALKNLTPRNVKEAVELISVGFKLQNEALGVDNVVAAPTNPQGDQYLTLTDFMAAIHKQIEEDEDI